MEEYSHVCELIEGLVRVCFMINVIDTLMTHSAPIGLSYEPTNQKPACGNISISLNVLLRSPQIISAWLVMTLPLQDKKSAP